jgi:hypothetical protein
MTHRANIDMRLIPLKLRLAHGKTFSCVVC